LKRGNGQLFLCTKEKAAKIFKKFLIGSEISCWGCLSSRQRIMREAQAYGLMEFPERHINGATPLRRAKYPRLRGLLQSLFAKLEFTGRGGACSSRVKMSRLNKNISTNI
jgi:hypothetical protein